jgi:PAS domain S-box-containing protein
MAFPFPDFDSDASTDTDVDSVAALLEQNAELKRQLQQCQRELQQAREAQRAQESDRQRVEAVLAESEARFHLIANNINQFFFLHSADECEYFYASPTYEKIWGRSCESLYQNPNSWMEAIHPGDRPKVLQSLVEQRNGLPVKRDYRIIRPDGSIRWVVTYLDPIYNEAGELVRWAGLTDDITDRKIAEATLLENQQFVEQIADSSTAILYIYDLLEQRNVYVNRQMQTILGYSPEAVQLMGNQLFPNLVHPDDLPKLVGRLEQCFTAGEHEIIDVEYRMRHANGEWRWIHSRDRIFNRTADGAPRQILGTAVDITAHKQTEAELQRQSRRSRLFSDIALTIRQSLDLPSILKTTVVEVHRFLQADRVLFLQLHSDDSGSVVEESVSPGYPALVGQHLGDQWFVEEFVESCRQGRICLIQNTATATLHPYHAEFLRQFGVQANLVVPILLSGASQSTPPGNSQKSHLRGTETPPPPVLWGLLIAHQCAYPRQWNDFETDMMRQLANQVGLAIVQSQLMEALRQSEEQRRLALDLTHIGSWDWQITGNKLIWSDNHYWLLGLEPDEGEVNIQTWYDRIHPDDLNWVRQRFYQSLAERTNYEAEYRVLHPNGRLRWMLSKGRGIYDEAGQAIRMVGVMIDISDRKTTEAILEQYERIVSATPDSIGLIDRNYCYRIVNQTFLRWNDKRYEEVVGHSILELVGEVSFRESIKPRLDRCLAGETISFEGWFDYPTGKRFSSITYAPCIEPDDTISGVMVSKRDLTDLKRTEQALLSSQERFAGILDIASDAIISIDSSQHITLFNQGAERIFGYTAAEVLGQPLSLLLPQRSTAAHQHHVREFSSTSDRAARRMGERSEVYGRRKNGSEFPAEASISKLEVGTDAVFTAILRDISDRKRVEQSLRQQAEREQALNRIVQAIRRSLDLEVIFTAATNEVAHLLNGEQSSIVQLLQASIIQYLPERRCWRRVAVDRNDTTAIDQASLEIPDDNNPLAHQLKQLQIVQVDNTDDIQDQVNREIAQAFSGKWLLVPLVVDEVLWGSLNLYSSEKNSGWQEEQIELARAVADQLAIAIHQANLFQQVQQLNQKLEERVQRRNTQLQLAMSVVHMGTWEWDLHTNRQYWSPENYALWGFSTDAQSRVLDQQGNEISPYPTRDLILDRVHPDDRQYFQQRHQEALDEGKILEIEHRLIWPDGSVHWRYGRGAQILDETGQAVKMIGVGIDITGRKLAEAQVQASLKEKETLLQEIHHRVKNNLQIVTSLLRMQSQQTDDPQVVTLFKEAQNRVQSMALIHEQIYQAPDLAAIDFGNYLSHLVNNLFRSYGVHQSQVQLAIATDDVMLPIHTAIPCGLMVNELVSNSLKYAFPDGQTGQVTIQLQAGTDAEAGDRPILTLTVADNGIGLPESLDLETLESLGLLIVSSLTHQLRGNLTVDCQAGTCFRITFPQP